VVILVLWLTILRGRNMLALLLELKRFALYMKTVIDHCIEPNSINLFVPLPLP
jgi:hypothetical protein